MNRSEKNSQKKKNYSPGMIAPKCFTSVTYHNLAPFLILLNTDVAKDAKLRKTRAFLIQNLPWHALKKISHGIVWLLISVDRFGPPKVGGVEWCQFRGSRSFFPSQSLIMHQTLYVYWQWNRMCPEVSMWHFAKMAKATIRLSSFLQFIICQAKKLHFEGAHIFQIVEFIRQN